MTTFTIDSANHITAWATEKGAARAEAGERFTSPEELQRLAAVWPAARLVEIWNSIPGCRPVHKFTDRQTAVARIWKAAQSLAISHGLAPAPVEANQPQSGNQSGHARAQKTARPAHHGRTAESKPSAREGSKKAQILARLQQSQGATLKDLVKATGWQPPRGLAEVTHLYFSEVTTAENRIGNSSEKEK